MFELVWLQQHRHTVVQFSNEFVWLGDDHRTRLQALTRVAVLPLIPKARDREDRRSITRCEIPGLLALRCVLPLVIARHGHEAALVLERFTKERLRRYRLDARIEGREPQFLERLAPPERHQTPSHLDELALAFMVDNRVRRISRTGIKARLKIWNRRRRRQAIERVN